MSSERRIRGNPAEPTRRPPTTEEGLARTALCVLVALVPLAFAAVFFEPYFAIKDALVQAGAPTVAILALIAVFKGTPTLARTPIWIALFVLALALGLSALWSSHPAASVEAAKCLFPYLLLFIVALHQMGQAGARAMLVTALLVAGAIEAAYVLLQYGIGDPIFLTTGLEGKWRTFGTLGNPNWTGEFLAVPALIALGRFVDLGETACSAINTKGTTARATDLAKMPWPRRWTLLALILMLLALATTLARGAWLAFLVSAGLFADARRRHARSTQKPVHPDLSRLALLIGCTGLLVVALLALPLLGNHQAIGHLLNLKSVRGRVWMWTVTWTMIRDAPWWGHGLGTFGLTFPQYQARAFSHEWATPFVANASFTSYAHNDYLQLWAESGLVALLAFGGLIWIAIRRGRELANDAVTLGCWAALISLLVNAAVAFPLHLPTSLMLFAVLLGTVEGAVCTKTFGISVSAPPARIVILALALAMCLIAYRSSYRRLAGDAALLRASDALEGDHRNEAERNIRIAIDCAPARPEGYSMLGRLHLERGEYEQALTAFDQAARLGFDTQVYELKATAFEKAGQIPAAIATLKELAWLRPDLRWPHQRLSVLNGTGKNHSEVDKP